MVAGCPGRMWSSWVSLKFAVTQMSSGTNIAERGPGRHIFADRGGEVDHPARLVGDDRRVGKVQLRLVALGLGLLDVGLARSRAAP